MIRVTTCVPGESSLTELAGAVDAHKREDPFSPVFVVAPSRTAALSIRRHLAMRVPSGFVNVTFGTSTQLAAELAEAAGTLDSKRRLDPALKRGFVASALAGTTLPPSLSTGDSQGAARSSVLTSPHTVRALVDSFGRLDEYCDLEEIEALLSGERSADIPPESALVLEAYVGFKRAYSSSYFDDADLFSSATDAVSAGVVQTIPSTIVYLPMGLTLREERLFAALASVSPVEGIVGATGDEAADRHLRSLVDRLEALGGGRGVLGRADLGLGEGPPPSPSICTAIDADEEVRTAVRTAQSWCADGSEAASTAIAYTSARPYQDLISDYLEEAGIPYWGTRRRTMGETVPGAVLGGILGVVESGYRRDTVISLTHAIPPEARSFEVDGEVYPIRPESWDRLSREAGITAGADEWSARLQALAERIARASEKSTAVWDCEAAATFIDTLRSLLPSLPGEAGGTRAGGVGRSEAFPSWGEVASALARVVRFLLDSAYRRQPASDGEDDLAYVAYQRILAAIEALSRMDSISSPSNFETVGLEVRTILEGWAPTAGRPKGLCVGPVQDLAGAALDSVFVVGASEGALPAPSPDDSLLQPVAQALGRPELAGRGPTAPEQRLRLYTLLRSAGRSVLAHPIADLQQRRPAQASWWLLDEANRRCGASSSSSGEGSPDSAGRLLAHEDLSTGRCGDWHIYVPSLEAGVRELAAAEEQEVNLAVILDEMAGGAAFEETSIVRTTPVLVRRAERHKALWSSHVDEWWGRVEVPADFTGGLYVSPTSLEDWALCPYKYFLRNVLRLGEVDRPEEIVEASSRDLGSAVHEVLERLFGEERNDERGASTRLGGDVWQRRLEERYDRLRDLVDDVFSSRGAMGKLKGDPALLELQKLRVLRALENTLLTEELLERRLELSPWKFEQALDKSVESGESGYRLKIKGVADRIDRVRGGRSLAVIDYKTGRLTADRRKEFQKSLPELFKLSDPSVGRISIETGTGALGAVERCSPRLVMAGGRFLQLPLYMFSALDLAPDEVDEFLGLIWHIDLFSAQNTLFGAALSRSELATVTSFVAQMVELMGSGVFVPNPGGEDYLAAGENCRNCEFDDVCPLERSAIWWCKTDDETFLSYALLTGGGEEGE